MDTMLVDELDAGDSLASLGRQHRARRSAESAIFVLVAHLADLYNPDSRPSGPRDSGRLPGREKTRRFGGQGTPLVWEFAVGDLAVELEMSTVGARFLVKDVLDTRHRLPRLWQRVCADEVKVGYARHVAQATHHLSMDAAGFVDAAVVESADGRITWSRFEAVVAGKVLAADPETAAAREAEAAAKQFARATRSSENGMKGFYLRSTTGVVARFDATVAYLADAIQALGDPDTEDLRRVKACLVMANPAQALELLQAFANHRAEAANQQDDDARGDAGSVAAEAAGETDEQLPIGEGDMGPGDNDADDPSPFTKPFRPGNIKPGDMAESWSLDWSKLLPTVTLYLHLCAPRGADDLSGGERPSPPGLSQQAR